MTIIEPGGFATDWGGSSAGRASEMAVYDEVRANRFKRSGRPEQAERETRRPRDRRSSSSSILPSLP